jgi:hypothetical protein
MFATLRPRVVNAQTVSSEAAEHPRIASAIREL